MDLIEINKGGPNYRHPNKFALNILMPGSNISQAGKAMGPPPCLAKKLAKPCSHTRLGNALIHFCHSSKITENQLYTARQAGFKCLYSLAGNTSSLFEFNKPISKKQGWILKDFEKNSTDFEGFEMDFELKSTKKPAQGYFMLLI